MLEHSLQVSLPHLLQWRLLTSRLNGRWQLEQEEEELLGCRRGANSLQGDLSRLASSLVVHCPGCNKKILMYVEQCQLYNVPISSGEIKTLWTTMRC